MKASQLFSKSGAQGPCSPTDRAPKLYATVSMTLDNSTPEEEFSLRYIAGPTFSEMIERIPQEKWRCLVKRAVNIVSRVLASRSMNEDGRPSNFIMDEACLDDGEHRFIMLGFVLCKLRRLDDTEAQWGRKKWTQDEDGAVGAVVQTILKNVGLELRFVHSFKWVEYAPLRVRLKSSTHCARKCAPLTEGSVQGSST